MIETWEDAGYCCKKRFMIFVFMMIGLIGMVVIGTTQTDSDGYSCSCDGYDDFCCVSGRSYVCAGQCACNDRNGGDTFCSSGNPVKKLDGAAQVIYFIFLSTFIVTIIMGCYYCCCQDDFRAYHDGSPPMCCCCLYTTASNGGGGDEEGKAKEVLGKSDRDKPSEDPTDNVEVDASNSA